MRIALGSQARGAAAALFLLAASCTSHPSSSLSPTTSPSASSSTDTVRVAGHVISAAGVTDVEAALQASGVKIPAGRILSLVTHRVLKSNASLAQILLNGAPATLTTPVKPGDVITFVGGHDTIEPVKTARVPVDLEPRAAALYESFTPGMSVTKQGVISGETTGSTLIAPPVIGKLRFHASVSLTFDDGPNGSFTSDMLSLLSSHHVKAVFCDVGARALVQSQFVAQQVADGHRLCDHTQTHPLNLPRLSSTSIKAQIDDGYRSIVASSGGVRPIYFRAPGGNWSLTVDRDAHADHLKLLGWTVDPRDWSLPGTPTIVERILDQLRPGGIVLMHDGGGNRSESVAALSELLDQLQAAGWTFTFPG
ncbi:MAG: polysaccharide deacetylase family protein [Actinomycetota bacterium]